MSFRKSRRATDAFVVFVNRKNVGRAVCGVLTQAKVERRLICGLLPAIAHLEKCPEDTLLCLLPETRPGDAATHIQTVLLQAFCYENCIPVIQVRISLLLHYVIFCFTRTSWSKISLIQKLRVSCSNMW